MASNIPPPEPLTRNNFQTWKKNILRLFEIEGLTPWLTTSEQPKIEGKSPVDDFRLKQTKSRAAGLLKLYCSPDIELEVAHLDDPAAIWDHLTKTFIQQTRSYKSLCLAEFTNINREIDEEIPTFIARFEELYRKLESAGETVSESHRCYKLLQFIDDGYDYIAREFENCETDKFEFKSLKDEILKEYNRKKLREMNRPESLVTSKGQISLDNKSQNDSSCMKCSRNKSFEKTNKNNSNTRVNTTLVTEYIQECCVSTNLPPLTRVWTLDSASTAHICQNKEFFIDLRDPLPGSIVKMGTAPHVVKGIGTVQFSIQNGLKTQTIQLKNTLFVPTVHRNLISMSKMDNAGYHAKLDRGFKIFSPRWKYLWAATLKDNFYILKGTPMLNNIAKNKGQNVNKNGNHRENKINYENRNPYQAFATESDIMLWHDRMGHCNLRALKTMFKNNMVEPNINLKGEEKQCEACIYGKNTRATYPKLKSIRSKVILDLVHSDIWGPSPYTAKHGYRYILTFLDDYSRRIFCYPLRTKDEVFIKMKNFISFVERQTGRKIKVIRSDNGMEFCSKRVQELLKNLGIRHERSNAYSAQQNGAAERVNRILLEGTRTLLKSANLPDEFWLEALQTTSYLRNRTLHSSINDIPFSRWYGRKPSIKHLRKFGCIAFLHIPPQKRNKLESRAKKGVFIGYSSQTRGYRVWIPEENKIYDSKHVTFHENEFRQVPTVPIMTKYFDDDYFSTKNHHEQVETIIEEKTDPEIKTQLVISNNTLNELSNDLDEVTFKRFTKERQSGTSKGKIDIYVDTPDGKTLRSSPELEEYCKNHNIQFDNSLNIFSKHCVISDFFTLKKLKEKEKCVEIEEAHCAEIIIPRNSKEAKRTPEAKHWKIAMDREMQNMEDRNVWTRVAKTREITKIIGTKWVYTLKNKNKEKKFKARLVALGNNQREGQDYYETYSPVVNFVLIRLFVAIFICALNWEHTLLDVKCAYLYGNVDTDLYIQQPIDYIKPGEEHCVLKLNKSLYGLHQAGRCWYSELHRKLIENGFEEIKGIQCVYKFKNKAVLMVYVDDLPIFARDKSTLKEIVTLIENLYDVENLGPIQNFLGIQFHVKDKGVQVNCDKYISNCVKQFELYHHSNTSLPLQPGVISSKLEQPTSDKEKQAMEKIPYRNLLGCLLYISGRCRPDVTFAVASLSQMVQNPAPVHWQRLKHILQYLSSTQQLGLWMPKFTGPIQLTAYCDSSWASDPDTRRSWTGYSLFINKIPIIWRTIKQQCVAISPMECEYIAASEAAKDIKYLNSAIQQTITSLKLNIVFQKPLMFCDNTAAIQFCKYEAENIRNRHIDIKYKFVRELHEQGLFDIKYVQTSKNLADILTKPVTKELFLQLRAAYISHYPENSDCETGSIISDKC